jgi:hypothetical protein
VKYRETFSESVEIPNKAGEAGVPSFIKRGVVFDVLKVLMNKDNVKVPETIQVPQENWRRSFSQHKEKHSDGKSKSWEIKNYVTEVSSLAKADILFLYHFQDKFELTTKDSFESKEAAEKLEMLMTKKKRK